MTVVQFTVPGTPKAKQRARVTRRGTYTPVETKAYENLVAQSYVIAHGTKQLTGSLYVQIVAAFQVPESWSKSKKQLALDGKIYPSGHGDADNLAKSILDGLNGYAYHDDASVVKLSVEKIYGAIPAAHIIIAEIQEPAAQDAAERETNHG